MDANLSRSNCYQRRDQCVLPSLLPERRRFITCPHVRLIVLGAKLASGARRAAFAAPPPRVQDHQYLAATFYEREREREREIFTKKISTLTAEWKKKIRYIHCSVEYEVCVSVCEGSKEGRKNNLLFRWKRRRPTIHVCFFFFLTHHQEKK